MLKYFLFLFTIISFRVSAQNTDSTYTSLDSAIVTSRSIKIKGNENPFIISSIDKQEIIQKGARTTPEALIGVAGVYLQKTNHGGGAAFIRGLTGNQTLLLVDGIRINNATYRYGPNQYLNTIDMFTIDKIDILKGIGAIEYGSDAMGGIIHLRTKEVSANSLNKINLSNTSKFISGDMEKTNRTDISYSNSKWEFLGGASFKNYGDLVAAAPIGKQSPTGYTERNYDFKTKLKLNKEHEITIASQNTNQFEVPIYHKIKLENFKINQVDRQVHNLDYIKYKYVSTKKWISEITTTGSIQRSIEQRSNQKNNSTIFRKEADTINNVGFTTEIISKPTKFWTINTGFDYYKDLVYSVANEKNSINNIEVQKRGLYPNAAEYKNSSLFNIHYINMGKLNIITGLRYNFLDIVINDISLGKIVVKPSALVTNLGLNYTLNKNNYLFGSITSGYRAPNIDDLGSLGIVDFRYELPSYDLKPEKSYNTELGYKHYSKKINLTVAAFNVRLKDIIARVQVQGEVINGYNVYNKKNIESSYIQGAEITYNHMLNPHLIWQSNASYTYGQNQTKNEPMRRIPPFFGQNRLAWNKNNFTAAFTHQFAGKQLRLAIADIDDNRIGKLGTPPFNTFNFDAGIQCKHLNIQTSLINLLNEQYKTHGSGVYGMGRAVSITMQWHL